MISYIIKYNILKYCCFFIKKSVILYLDQRECSAKSMENYKTAIQNVRNDPKIKDPINTPR